VRQAMSEIKLKEELIRLAFEKPELREDIPEIVTDMKNILLRSR
jgi:hypothetical protein